jgi:hypothetical protein
VLLLFPAYRQAWRRSYLCHRGVDPALLREILAYFRNVEGYEVVVQNGSGLSISFPAFRRLARTHIEADYDLIIILNRDFPWHVYKHTLGYLVAKADREGSRHCLTRIIRVDDCEGYPSLFSGTIPGLYADLSEAHTSEERFTALMHSQPRRIR